MPLVRALHKGTHEGCPYETRYVPNSWRREIWKTNQVSTTAATVKPPSTTRTRCHMCTKYGHCPPLLRPPRREDGGLRD